MKKNEVYTELSIQIGSLTAKVDKILELLLEQQKPYIINSDFVNCNDVDATKLEEYVRRVSLSTNEEFDREFK